MSQAQAHIIHEEHGLVTRRHLDFVPRVGDEIRVSEDKYYVVTKVVWPFDEKHCPMQRVNIGVADIE